MKFFSIKYLLFIALVWGCSENMPTNLLAKKDMISLLVRIHLIEARVSTAYLPSDSALSSYKNLEDSLFKKFKTTKAIYEKSYKYYVNHPEIMDDIYTNVVDSLSLREAIRNID